MSPQLNTISSIDPWNNNDFVNKTADMKGTVGDMLDKSAELSAKRAEESGGVDPVKKEFYKNYSKERKGAKHPSEKGKSYESKNGNNKIKFDCFLKKEVTNKKGELKKWFKFSDYSFSAPITYSLVK